MVSPFQFHKGAIRTSASGGSTEGDPYFNSIKVRLELEVRVFSEVFNRFQFHKGAIRTKICNDHYLYRQISIP